MENNDSENYSSGINNNELLGSGISGLKSFWE